jgi:hypothetical protein
MNIQTVRTDTRESTSTATEDLKSSAKANLRNSFFSNEPGTALETGRDDFFKQNDNVWLSDLYDERNKRPASTQKKVFSESALKCPICDR